MPIPPAPKVNGVSTGHMYRTAEKYRRVKAMEYFDDHAREIANECGRDARMYFVAGYLAGRQFDAEWESGESPLNSRAAEEQLVYRALCASGGSNIGAAHLVGRSDSWVSARSGPWVEAMMDAARQDRLDRTVVLPPELVEVAKHAGENREDGK